MGMLNNPHYRIKTKPESSQQLGLGIHCEHPTKSGGEAGGWMEREMLANAPPAAEVVVSTGPDTSRLPTYSPEEVSPAKPGWAGGQECRAVHAAEVSRTGLQLFVDADEVGLPGLGDCSLLMCAGSTMVLHAWLCNAHLAAG